MEEHYTLSWPLHQPTVQFKVGFTKTLKRRIICNDVYLSQWFTAIG